MTTNSPTDALRLVPCPFCGGDAEIEQFGNTRRSTIYCCQQCGCKLETGEEFNHGRAWNLLAAPASPLPEGGGWKPARNDVARRCDPKAWEFYDRHIDNPIMGAECRAEVAASIRMADAILALPAAPTGDAK